MSEVEQPGRERKPGAGKRGLVIAAGAALALFGVAGALALRTLTAAPPEKTPETDPQVLMAPEREKGSVHDLKNAAAFGYPAYPEAYAFHSMESPDGSGSVAYMVKKANADGVIRFYVEKLGAAGWQFSDREKTRMRPSGADKGPLFSGYRARWTSADQRKGLLLWALDDPQRPGAAQVLLTWQKLKRPADAR